jgi:AAA ATPase domain/Methyltransferase domain
VVLLCGEPGIGKSRLAQTLSERLANEPQIRLRCQGSPYYTNTAFYPIIAHLERAMPCARDAPPAVKLDALEALLAQAGVLREDVVPLFAALLSIPCGERYPPLTMSPQRQKDKTIEALIDQVRGLARQKPVLYIFEDVHWIEPTSLEMVDGLVNSIQDAGVLMVITYRPECTPSWGAFPHVTTHMLNRLSRWQVMTMVDKVTGGKPLPTEILEQIVTKTDGVPLFVEELTKAVLESGLLADQSEHSAARGWNCDDRPGGLSVMLLVPDPDRCCAALDSIKSVRYDSGWPEAITVYRCLLLERTLRWRSLDGSSSCRCLRSANRASRGCMAGKAAPEASRPDRGTRPGNRCRDRVEPPHYPAALDLVGIDPDPSMLARASQRAAHISQTVCWCQARAEVLPFRDASFDAVVGTRVFCPIPDPP